MSQPAPLPPGLSIFDDLPPVPETEDEDESMPSSSVLTADTADEETEVVSSDQETQDAGGSAELSSEPATGSDEIEAAAVDASAGDLDGGAAGAAEATATVGEARWAHPSFPTVRWGGLDRSAVEGYLATLDAHTSEATRATESELERLRAHVADLEQRLAETETPTYAGLGGRAATMLRLAQEEADAVRTRAAQVGEESRARALAEADALRADAEREAAQIRSDQLAQIEERRAAILADAIAERELARAEAQDVVAAASREAEQLRLAAQQEVNSMRATARHEAAQLRAAAEREASEARRTLAVERDRMTREAAERHTAALDETDRLVKEAEARAAAAETRTREAIAAATRQREQAKAEGDAALNRSRQQAEQIIEAARRQASSIVSSARNDAERQEAAARQELEALHMRRDGILAQLGQLQDVLRSFAGAEPAESATQVLGRPASASQAAADSEAPATARERPDDEDLDRAS